MIRISNIFSLLLLLALIGCQPEMHITDNTFYGVTYETQEVISEMDVNLDDAPFFARIQINAANNARDIDNVDVYISFTDNVFDNVSSSKSRVLVQQIPNDLFVNNINTNGRPEIEFRTNKEEMLALLQLPVSVLDGGDEFVVTFEVVFEENISFAHKEIVQMVCPDTTPPSPGTWSFILEDALSDSWDGAALRISIDGNSTDITLEDGVSDKTFDVNIPGNTSSLNVEYIEGFCCADEHTITIISSRQVEVLKIEEPESGEITDFNYCGF